MNSTPSYPDESFDSGAAVPPESHQSVTIQFPQSRPVVVYTLLGITILIYVLQMVSQWTLGFDLPAALGMKVNELILRGELWRLFTPMLLHGSILHIVFNMYALNAFGPGLEQHYGHTRFLGLYLLGGFSGNVLSFVFSQAPSLGSSTAIFGLLAAEGVFLYQNRKLFGNMAQSALRNIVMIGLVNLAIGLSPGIDNWGHIGGLLGGGLFAWFAGPLLSVEGISPSLYLEDRRRSTAVLTAWVGVALLFAAIAAAVVITRLG